MVLVAADDGDHRRSQALHDVARMTARQAEATVWPAFGAPQEIVATIESISGPRVLLPTFLVGGDPASADVCAQLAPPLRGDVLANDPLGPTPALVADLAHRLTEAGWRHNDGVVLVADGARNGQARREVAQAARMLGQRLDTPVHIAHARRGVSSARTAVHRLRRSGYRRIALAPWQLVSAGTQADTELAAAGADVVAAPLWPSERVVETLLAQHRLARARLAV